MPDTSTLQPAAFNCEGGLVLNRSTFLMQPGEALVLENFEPDVEGGYRRIEGYDKYDSVIIPPYGAPVVHGDGQSGTGLILAAMHTTPEAGDVFSLDGGLVAGATQTGTSLDVDGLRLVPCANGNFSIDGCNTVYVLSDGNSVLAS